MSSTKDTTNNQEYENDSHVMRKKKAAESQFKKKNYRDIVNLINDEDDEVVEKYARYIK